MATFMNFILGIVYAANYTVIPAPFTSISNYDYVDVSDSGQFMVGCNATVAAISIDYGTVWNTLVNPLWLDCEGIAMSDSGSTIVLISQDALHISTDTGSTWSAVDLTAFVTTWNLYRNVDIDSSGTNIVFTNQGEIFTSTDGGSTWSMKTNTLSGDIRDVTSDNSGQYLSIATGQWVYISDDFGDTWTDVGLTSSNYHSIATDDSGQNILTFAFNGSDYDVFLSDDRWSSWNNISSLITLGWGDINDLRDVNISDNGLFMVIFTEDGLFYSNDSGASWTLAGLNSVSHTYTRSAVSSTGQYIITGDLSGQESSYVSQDYWVSFIAPFDVVWFSTDMNGQKQVVVTGEYNYVNGISSSQGGYIYTSEDGGQTLVTRFNAGNRKWSSVSASDDRVEILATVNPSWSDGGYTYTSDDSGATWTENTTLGLLNWIDSDMDNTGDNSIIAEDGNWTGGYIYTSADSGATWTERTSAGQRNWSWVSINGDGTKLSAIHNWGYIYTSDDSGATWTERTSAGQRNWSDVDSDENGDTIIATVNNGYVYISYNGGSSWTEQTSFGVDYWHRTAIDKTGSVFAVGYGNDSGYWYWNVFTSINGVDWEIEGISDDWSVLAYSGNSKELYALSSRGDSILEPLSYL
jgi:Photosynthesis system II assembly factor YCF48